MRDIGDSKMTLKDFGLSYRKNGVAINEMEKTTRELDLWDRSRSSESFR